MSGRHAGTHPAPGTPIAVSFGPGTGKRRKLGESIGTIPAPTMVRPRAVRVELSSPSNQRGAVR